MLTQNKPKNAEEELSAIHIKAQGTRQKINDIEDAQQLAPHLFNPDDNRVLPIHYLDGEVYGGRNYRLAPRKIRRKTRRAARR